MHEAYFGGCPVGLTREHCLTHGGGVVQGWPQSALDSLVVWGSEDFMGEWFPYPTRLHTDELGVRAVGLSHKEIEDSLKSEASCCVSDCCYFVCNRHRRPGETKWPGPLTIVVHYSLVITTVNYQGTQHKDVLRTEISEYERNVLYLRNDVSAAATLAGIVKNTGLLLCKGG